LCRIAYAAVVRERVPLISRIFDAVDETRGIGIVQKCERTHVTEVDVAIAVEVETFASIGLVRPARSHARRERGIVREINSTVRVGIGAGGTSRARIAAIRYTVAVSVARVVESGAEVTSVPDAVSVLILLVGIRRERAIIATASEAVVVLVGYE